MIIDASVARNIAIDSNKIQNKLETISKKVEDCAKLGQL